MEKYKFHLHSSEWKESGANLALSFSYATNTIDEEQEWEEEEQVVLV